MHVGVWVSSRNTDFYVQKETNTKKRGTRQNRGGVGRG